jgi:response regulator RpfG family c-di-GMP phosphodiesterase
MGYLPIRVTTLKGQVRLGFNVYVQLPHKILLYAAGMDDIEDHRIKYLKKKKVRKLFIDDSQESLYQDYVDRCLTNVMSDDSVSLEEKSSLVVNSGEATAEKIYEDPHSKKSYDAAQNTATNLIGVLAQNDELLKGIFDSKVDADNDTHDTRMQKHSLNTSSLCISFGEFLGLPKDQVEVLGVAGLFHDVAYSQYNDDEKELFFKRVADMENAELTRYREHPEQGSVILEDKDFASRAVIDLILIHEEKRGGNGFPNKLKSFEPVQEVLAIAAFYDREVTCFGVDRDSVLEDFSINQLGNYDLEMIKKFKLFIKKTGL